MTDSEILEKQAEAAKGKKAEIKKRIEAETKAGFLNPFGEGVSYDTFLGVVKASKLTVAEYCEKHLTKDQIEWLENEIKLLN